MKTGCFEENQAFLELGKSLLIHGVRTRPAKSVICIPKPLFDESNCFFGQSLYQLK